MKSKGLVLVAVSLLIGCIGFGSVQASGNNEEDSQTGVYLRATLKNNPAMRPVEWKIYRADNTLVKSATTHSMLVPLKPGNYKATASLNSVTRDRSFTVMNNSKVDVVIALD